jgi:hypothetical protein
VMRGECHVEAPDRSLHWLKGGGHHHDRHGRRRRSGPR